MEYEDKIKTHKRKFKKYLIFCLILSILLTFGLYKIFAGISESGGSKAVFNSDHVLVIFSIFIGCFFTFLVPVYLVHVILVMKDK